MNPTFEEFRPQMFALAYRMLGTRADAEDIVQEAFLRWQSANPAEVRSPRSYLNSVVARLSLDALKSARRKRETYVGTWLPEPIASGSQFNPASTTELADTLSVAFLHVLESLTPSERVAFLMHDVFGEEYREVAKVLETTESNCRQLVTRARQHVQARRPRYQVDPQRHQQVLREFLAACAGENKDSLLGLLRQESVLYADGGGKRQSAINPIFGADRITRFFLGIRKKFPVDLHAVPVMVGGVPSVLLYDGATIDSLLSLDLDESGLIQGIYIIRNPDKLEPIMRR
jgi:RNA polymerase sigma-70 factor (ECF subfamily)